MWIPSPSPSLSSPLSPFLPSLLSKLIARLLRLFPLSVSSLSQHSNTHCSKHITTLRIKNDFLRKNSFQEYKMISLSQFYFCCLLLLRVQSNIFLCFPRNYIFFFCYFNKLNTQPEKLERSQNDNNDAVSLSLLSGFPLFSIFSGILEDLDFLKPKLFTAIAEPRNKSWKHIK